MKQKVILKIIKALVKVIDNVLGKIKQRVCIYPKSIQCITGKSYRQSTRLMQKIKKDLNKLENEFLTIDEFCSYSGIKYEQVTHLIFG